MKKFLAIAVIAISFASCNNPTEDEVRISYEERPKTQPVKVDSLPVDSLHVDSVIWK